MTQQGDAVAGELATEKKWVLKGIWPFSHDYLFPEFFPGQTVNGAFLTFPF